MRPSLSKSNSDEPVTPELMSRMAALHSPRAVVVDDKVVAAARDAHLGPAIAVEITDRRRAAAKAPDNAPLLVACVLQ